LSLIVDCKSKENQSKEKNMTMIVNSTVTQNGLNAYNFVSRGTEYTVIENGQHANMFDVYSNRKSVSFSPQVAVMTLKEMKARSKALSHLAQLIEA